MAYYQREFERLCGSVNVRLLPASGAPARPPVWALLSPTDVRSLAHLRMASVPSSLSARDRDVLGAPGAWPSGDGPGRALDHIKQNATSGDSASAGGGFLLAGRGSGAGSSSRASESSGRESTLLRLGGLLPDGVTIATLREAVAGLAIHLPSMSWRERLRLLLADRIVHEPFRFALASNSRSTSKYGLAGTVKSLLVGHTASWADVQTIATSSALAERRRERIARGVLSSSSSSSSGTMQAAGSRGAAGPSTSRVVGDLAADEIAPATSAAARRRDAEAAARETGGGSLLRFAFRDAPSPRLALHGGRPRTGASLASRRLQASARDSPTLAALLAKHGGLGAATESKDGSVRGVAASEQIGAVLAAAQLPGQAVATQGRAGMAESLARSTVLRGRGLPMHSAGGAPAVFAVPTQGGVSMSRAGSQLTSGNARRAEAAAAGMSAGAALDLCTGEGAGLLALLDAAAADAALSDTGLVPPEDDPLVGRVSKAVTRAVEEALRALPADQLRSLVTPGAQPAERPWSDPDSSKARSAETTATAEAVAAAAAAAPRSTAGSGTAPAPPPRDQTTPQRFDSMRVGGKRDIDAPAPCADAPGEFARSSLLDHERRMTEGREHRSQAAAHSAAWTHVRTILSRVPVAMREAFRGREARAALAFERRAQWLQHETARAIAEARASSQAAALHAVAQAAELRAELEACRLDLRRARQAAAKAGVRLPQLAAPRAQTADREPGASAWGDRAASPPARRRSALPSLHPTSPRAGVAQAEPESPSAASSVDMGAAWMDVVGLRDAVGCQTPPEWAKADFEAAAAAHETSLARMPDEDTVLEAIATGRGAVAEFVRVLAGEWAAQQRRALEAQAAEALRAAVRQTRGGSSGAGGAATTLVNELRTRIASPPWFRWLDMSSRAERSRAAEAAAWPADESVSALAARLVATRRRMLALADLPRDEGGGAATPTRPPSGKPGPGGRRRLATVAQEILHRGGPQDLGRFLASERQRSLAQAKRDAALAVP